MLIKPPVKEPIEKAPVFYSNKALQTFYRYHLFCYTNLVSCLRQYNKKINSVFHISEQTLNFLEIHQEIERELYTRYRLPVKDFVNLLLNPLKNFNSTQKLFRSIYYYLNEAFNCQLFWKSLQYYFLSGPEEGKIEQKFSKEQREVLKDFLKVEKETSFRNRSVMKKLFSRKLLKRVDPLKRTFNLFLVEQEGKLVIHRYTLPFNPIFNLKNKTNSNIVAIFSFNSCFVDLFEEESAKEYVQRLVQNFRWDYFFLNKKEIYDEY